MNVNFASQAEARRAQHAAAEKAARARRLDRDKVVLAAFKALDEVSEGLPFPYTEIAERADLGDDNPAYVKGLIDEALAELSPSVK